MYLKNALIINSGPLEKLEVQFQFNEDNSPKPTILVGQNGSGKTNFLSFVTDALIEIASKHFNDVAPAKAGGGHRWHRTIGGSTLRSGARGELAVLNFAHNEQSIQYVSKGGQVPKTEVSTDLFDVASLPNWQENGAHKSTNAGKDITEGIFRSGCYVSFPANRSELPHWSSQAWQNAEASFDAMLSDTLGKPISIDTAIEATKPWLVDVLMDQMVDSQLVLQHINNPQQLAEKAIHAIQHVGMLNNFLAILRVILGKPQARVIRRGRGFKESKLQIFDGDTLLFPNLNALSIGQATLLAEFATILRYTDNGAPVNLKQMQGIVVIDEVDAHLHADLLYSVLPNLIKMFPRVQFILTAHSPLLPLGMENAFGADGFSLLDMPEGRSITAERFSEFQNSFEYLTNTKKFESAVVEHASLAEKPLILCEGKTDPKYMRTAAELLGFRNLFEHVNFDWVGVEIDGKTKDGGESNLRLARKILLNNPSLLRRKLILLFDCDVTEGDLDQGQLHVRTIIQNTENTRCDRGIENLLPTDVFEERFFINRERKKGADVTQSSTLNKRALCDFLCDEKRSEADFTQFRQILEELDSILFPPENT